MQYMLADADAVLGHDPCACQSRSRKGCMVDDNCCLVAMPEQFA